MVKNSTVPTYDFFKKLDSKINFEYRKLEKVYTPYDASSAHRHDYHEIILFDKDGGTHEIDFQKHSIKKNSLHFIFPGQVHLLKRNKNVTGHVLAFKEEVFLPNAIPVSTDFFFLSAINSSVLKIDLNTRNKIDPILLNLIDEEKITRTYKEQIISAYLLLFLIEIVNLYEKSPDLKKATATKNIYDQFKRLVDKNILTNHSVAEYASLMNITPGHLNDSIKSETGKNASEQIHERLILEAKRLLYHSTKSVKEISALLNYDDPSYFNRFFKLHTGITPKDFRGNARNE